jgi:aspartyl protease family protein
VKRAAAALALFIHAVAWGASVTLTGVSWSEAQIIVNGTTQRSLFIGETSPEGVRLLYTRGNSAVFEIDGKQVELALGQSSAAEAVLRADRSGHFVVNALLNGTPVHGVIDTGASYVALNWEQAERLGIDRRQGQRIWMNTANGRASATLVKLESVQVGDIGITNVPAVVIDGGAEVLPVVLIGMSFLRHVDMRRSGNTMTLSRPQ